MPPFSILMFIFSACLLLYALILAVSRDYKMIARYWASELKTKREQKRYARMFAKIMALVALIPAAAGVGAMFHPLAAAGGALAMLLVSIFAGKAIYGKK